MSSSKDGAPATGLMAPAPLKEDTLTIPQFQLCTDDVCLLSLWLVAVLVISVMAALFVAMHTLAVSSVNTRGLL